MWGGVYITYDHPLSRVPEIQFSGQPDAGGGELIPKQFGNVFTNVAGRLLRLRHIVRFFFRLIRRYRFFVIGSTVSPIVIRIARLLPLNPLDPITTASRDLISLRTKKKNNNTFGTNRL